MIRLYKAFLDEIPPRAYDLEYNRQGVFEKERLDSFTPQDKKRTLAGRILLRQGVGELYGKNDYKMTTGQSGKPLLPFCHFSIAHSAELAVCAFGTGEIGVDVEKLREIKKRESYTLFSPDETAYVNANDEEHNRRFLEVWTKKEAYIKMMGLSLADGAAFHTMHPPTEISIDTFWQDDYIITVCERTDNHHENTQ